MAKETVHVLSHSHWDREWYLPLEEHRMRLVELFDDLFELFETDPEFRSFHLDGQTIVLEDYLEIRPQNWEKLKRYIDEGCLVIGPFYILQDDYLITSEAHVRNALIGHIDSQKWGKAPKIGYYPDTFGNVGQVPQLMRQAGIDVALFGRGVKPVGFDNQVLSDDKFQSSFSEMNWQGADGSRVLGILFANWYSNGNEIPAEKGSAKVFWEKKLADVRKYASTSHYLLMNGCDHQPVQKNLSQALRVARELYPDINFVHSTFEEYIAAVKTELPDHLNTVTGELTSQETDGWYTLANTASSRIYLKQANDAASNLLERVVEPLVVMTGEAYPQDELRYAWKLLLQNAPHDSICGCSIDPVHREMEMRFEKVMQVGHFLCQRTLENWEKKVDTSGLDGYIFTVFNTAAQSKTQEVSLDLVIDQVDFRDGQLEKHFADMEGISLPSLALYTSENEWVEAQIEDLGVHFRYDLPKDAFRSANFARKIRVTFVAENLPAFSWKTFQVKEGQAREAVMLAQQALENDRVKIWVNEAGQLVWTDKANGVQYPDFLIFEDTGDLGNEYIFMAPKGEAPIHSELVSFAVTQTSSAMSRAKVFHRLTIPTRMADTLLEEQVRLVEFRHRTSQRHTEMAELLIETEMTLYTGQGQVEFVSHFVNQMKDHRVRAIFNIGLQAESHVADSIFETVTRPNNPHSAWENPSNCERSRSFIQLTEGDTTMTVGSRALHEYEILDHGKIALTILRAVGELGDWGYFPTPEAQCLRDFTVHYSLEVHDAASSYQAIHHVQAFQTDLLATRVSQHAGSLPADFEAIQHPVLGEERFCVTSLKQAEDCDNQLLRYYNLSAEEVALQYESCGVNLLEEQIGLLPTKVGPQEIRTEIMESYHERRKL